MLSSKRLAQLGLGAASFVLVASVAVLLAGAADVPRAAALKPTASAGHAALPQPIATVSPVASNSAAEQH